MIFQNLTIANAERQKEWDPDNQVTLAYRGNELAGETGEAFEAAMNVIAMGAAVGRACNIIKKIERERMGIRGSRATIDALADELADAIICIDLVASSVGIDLQRSVINKFNETSAKYGLTTRMR